jgi:formylglycine-generating enzyme required for sulfatase activity
MSADPSDLDLGQTLRGFAAGQKLFNRYTLVRMLGRGGMGVVWLARDEELGRETALKFLPEVVATDRAAVEDMKREVRRAIDLAHPHIVKIHDFVTDGVVAAVSMEYVAGQTLSSVRCDEPGQVFTVEKLAPIVRQLCAALDYAHEEAQVVHRDLKPANLMLDRRGRVKVLDFGIAASITDSVSRVSRATTGDGSLPYMSPQQLGGEKPAVTDDVYGIGATIFELLTGKPPFYSGGAAGIMHQIQTKVPASVAERRVDLGVVGDLIPAEWEETIRACLAKERSGRPQSAGEIIARLERTGESAAVQPSAKASIAAPPKAGEPASPLPNGAINEEAKPKQSRAGLYAGLAAAVIALVGGGYHFGVHAPEQTRLAEVARASAALEKQPLPVTGQAWTIPDLNLTLMPIAAGSFAMGSALGTASAGCEDEEPVKGVTLTRTYWLGIIEATWVTLTRPYWLGKTEVTQGEWEAVMGSNPSNFKGRNLPVEQVTWTEAMEFCRKLTEREQAAERLPEGYVYTLPTEAQWEYACRAGTTGAYAGELGAMAWYNRNSGNMTNPVGTKRANAWGLLDMHGNVWEWVSDWNGTYVGGSDPQGASSGSTRVVRGGGWWVPDTGCRSAFRGEGEPGNRNPALGFRLALSSVP